MFLPGSVRRGLDAKGFQGLGFRNMEDVLNTKPQSKSTQESLNNIVRKVGNTMSQDTTSSSFRIQGIEASQKESKGVGFTANNLPSPVKLSSLLLDQLTPNPKS